MENEKEEYDFEWEGDYTRTWLDKFLFEWLPMALLVLVAIGCFILLIKNGGAEILGLPPLSL